MAALFNRLQEFSVPLIFGVICAIAMANSTPELYDAIVHRPFHKAFQNDSHESAVADSGHADASHGVVNQGHDKHATTANNHGDAHEQGSHSETAIAGAHGAAGGHASGSIWDHIFTLHFLVNDLFMVLFFGVAAKEITEACLPGGPLNPIRKAFNPLAATLGGVLGPVFVYLLLNAVIGESIWAKGWGIPTATDIALAWLVAKFIFGAGHAAVSFLLLLAVADDAIGLGIIAFAYPDPLHPTEWANTAWIIPGVLVAAGLRWSKVANWVPYVLFGGGFCWWGLYSAHLHPALALVFIVPFLPGPKFDLGLYAHTAKEDDPHLPHSPLQNFEHQLKPYVDFGLFFFAFANAGVAFSQINNLTWIVMLSLLIGKTIGIMAFSTLAERLGCPLPSGMTRQHTAVVGLIAGLGLTVALFVSGQAFTDPGITAAAKMGAVLSVIAAPIAFLVGGVLGMGPFRFLSPLFAKGFGGSPRSSTQQISGT